MNGVVFEQVRRVDESSPNRGDVGCFIGFVDRRPGDVPDGILDWLRDNGWTRDGSTRPPKDDALEHKPVPIENFETFDLLFRWNGRRASGWATWLGCAVRSFFAQGGSRCYVVRVGDALECTWMEDSRASADLQATSRDQLVPSGANASGAGRGEMDRWRGIEVVQGLPEVSFVCLPDLPELVADARLSPVGLEPEPPGPEQFEEVIRVPKTRFQPPRLPSRSPACTREGYERWFKVLNHVGRFLGERRPDVQLLAAVPLPADGSVAQGHLLDALAPATGGKRMGLALDLEDGGSDAPGIATHQIQLAFPWLVTEGAALLPGQLEPPDGTLAGVLAKTVAFEGVHRSLGRQPLRLVSRFSPALSRRDCETPARAQDVGVLMDRVTLLGESPNGPRVLTDVTTSLQRAHRPGSVRRLTAAILRTSRRLGEEAVFEPSGPELWRTIERRLGDLLTRFYRAGALLGDNPSAGFTVRCDRTTMTQNDLDNGRVLARVEFAPAHPVGRITVVLSLRDGVSLNPEPVG